ncbi:hypothetical protein VPH35_123490 [Triticum aestivum]
MYGFKVDIPHARVKVNTSHTSCRVYYYFLSFLGAIIDFHIKIRKLRFQVGIISQKASPGVPFSQLKEDDKLLVVNKCIDEFPQLVMQISVGFSFLVFFCNLHLHRLFGQYRTEALAVSVQFWI